MSIENQKSNETEKAPKPLRISERIILGLDPGTRIMGYGVIRVKDNQLSVIRYGIINLTKYPNQALKLKRIAERVNELIENYMPDEVALEAPFYGKNVQTTLKLGRAQGVAMATALVKGIPIAEYAPRRIKQAVTGSGTASKEQVAAMLKAILNFKPEKDIKLDATDALGVAVCHYFQNNDLKQNNAPKPKTNKKSGGWGDFVKDNPNRIK